jgi:hypothetical protein
MKRRRGCNECANKSSESGLQGRVVKNQDHGHVIQERQRSVLTNQCLEKEMNAEPPGQGTEEGLRRLTGSDKFIALERP